MGSRRLAVPLLSTLVLLAACGPDEEGAPPGGSGQPPPTAGDSASAAGPSVRAVGADDTVRIELDEYGIAMADSLSAGRRVLRIRNRGFEEHDLVFRWRSSDSVAWRLDRRLGPGEHRVVDVALEPGAYAVICTVSNHESRGMFTDLDVVRSPGG
ncbi:MAG: hypothetical protein GWM92_11725 [Gemmatimonadetes bacterium]|nr:hypothetical protein [Gemmatimonadota bacterium]NIR78259.1 hypothetical protein [Gemmatimonadota bacterium]NIT88025.1 hypothetical protein [Gemmatimonadota bacterium]NIU30709.1 hypothetical protein [Gemmatimonadota bacterium]NIU35506.1 hypothetical protein [Gemmatimonadota bacterium]